MLVPVHVHGLGIDSSSETPVVFLKESTGERVLPIWIGNAEASAIAVRLLGRAFERPLTHDLFTSVFQAISGHLNKVVISRGSGNLYRADLYLQRDDEEVPVDARPSDGVVTRARIGRGRHTLTEAA